MKTVFLFFLLSVQFAYGQDHNYDSLEQHLATASTDTQKLEVIKSLVDLAFQSDIEKALGYAEKGVSLSEKINNKNWQPRFYEMAGRMHANLLHLDSASYYFDKAMDGYLAVNNIKGQATTAFKMAWIFRKRGDLDEALQKDLTALKLMEKSDDKRGICDALTRVSTDLTRQNRLEEALDYAQQAIAMAEKNNLTGELYFVNNNAGDVAIASNNHQQALNYFNKALEIARKQKMGIIYEMDVMNSRGNALKKLGRYPEAIKDYKICLDSGKAYNYPMAVTASIANLGEVNLLMGNYKEALKYQLETTQMQERNSDLSNLTENYNHLSTIYGKMGNFEEALNYKQKAYNLHDSILSVKSDATMSKMLTQYESQKKEATINSQQREITEQRKVQWLTGGMVVLLLGLLVFGFISYRSRTRRNRLLAVKNAENELLLKEIHHRVKNNLEVVSSLLALQSAQIDDPGTKEVMLEGQNRVHSIGIVHQKLYQGTHLGSIEMKDYFLNLSESILDSFGAESRVTVELAMEKLEVDIDTAVPLGLIVNELLTNTIKYAFTKGTTGNVQIKLKQQQDGTLNLEVSDNGIGKSGLTQGTGFGTQLISLLTRQLGGKMKEEIKNGTHTYFDFQVLRIT